jgi:D-cysteine desulfhydrase family pyridoxal phosphate-dependent enzyme
MNLPRLQLAALPTPIETLPNIGATLGGIQVLVKRDDLTGLGGGGNKVRKLEFLTAEAQANGARMLITTGAAQSNHCRQTAAAAARLGLDCRLVLVKPDGGSSGGNLLLDGLFGAEITWCEKSQRDAALRQAFDAAWQDGKRPFLIPYGGSSPTGAAAYYHAFEEMLAQGVEPDIIVFASSSGGTQAGLALGAAAHGNRTRVLGISVDEPAAVLQKTASQLAREAAARMRLSVDISQEEILVIDDYIQPGYGVLTNLERDAIRLFARREGLLLDPVYTGRAAGGLLDLARKGYFKAGQQVLFWHTGGTPALFASQYAGSLG